MFYSQDILAKKGKLGTVWIAANFHCDAESSTRLTLTRREYCNVDIEEACREIVFPSRPFALRLSASLMVGIVRIYKQQTHYIYLDLKQIWQSLKHSAEFQRSSIDLPKTKPRSTLLPDVLKTLTLDSSFSCLRTPKDVSFELPPYSESDYFNMDIDTMVLPSLPDTPDIRPGSVEGSPFTTDPQNITLQEDNGTPLESLQIQVPGEQDFGDGDMEEVLAGPVTLLDNVPMPLLGLSPDWEEPVAGGGSDYSCDMTDADSNGVLLFDEEIGDFRVYSSRPTPQDSHTGGSHQPQPPATPTAGEKAAQSSSPSTPFVMAPKLQSHGGPGHTPRREFRKAKRKLAFDTETKLEAAVVKSNLGDGSSTLRKVPWKMPKRITAKVLFSQPCCTVIGRSKIFRSLWERGAVVEREPPNEFDLEEIWKDGNGQVQTARPQSILPAAHQKSNPASTLTTPDLEAGRGYSDSISLGISGDQERMRGRQRDGEASYNVSRNNSAAMTMSDFSGANSMMSGASFSASTMQRKPQDNQPIMGGLSPITDEDLLDPEMSLNNPADLGFPQLDISYGSSHTATPTQQRSPFIESETTAYGRRVATVMHGRQQIEFQTLLPRGSTRRTACRAFAHMLELVSKGVFEAQQEQPYGSITLRRGENASV